MTKNSPSGGFIARVFIDSKSLKSTHSWKLQSSNTTEPKPPTTFYLPTTKSSFKTSLSSGLPYK